MQEIVAEKYFPLFEQGETAEKFEAFYGMLAETNEKINLTRIIDANDCRVKHFLDSVLGEKFFPQGAACLEVGSGGGFPSVPLMIARPDLSFTLVESVGKKCDFLAAVCEKLHLSARVENARAEDLAKLPAFREEFDVCCARAVARLNTLSEYCLPFVKKGGAFVAYKAGDAEEEIAEAENALRVLGGRAECAAKATLPDGAGARTIICVRKERPTPPQYPRGRGKERKNPL